MAPQGFSTLTSVLIVPNAQETIDSYKSALGAAVSGIFNCPKTGKILHSRIVIEGATLFVSDIRPDMGANATGRQEFYLYVENADQAYQKAKAAGFQGIEDPADMFWGDRSSALTDLNGNTWKLAHKVRDVSDEEIETAIKGMMSQGN